MSDPGTMTEPKPELEIKSDADWKQRVKQRPPSSMPASATNRNDAEQPAQSVAADETGDTARVGRRDPPDTV